MTDYPELFSHISNQEFRACIESDWQELNKAIQNGSWKSAHVLAGSIIEAVLADCLYADAECEATKAGVLNKFFNDLITESQRKSIISSDTKQICDILKNYRNLIHPGRTVRTGGKVDEVSASTSRNLVIMVARDVAESRKKTYGYTAEQVLNKLYGDPVGFTVARVSLVAKLPDVEKERLLLQIIPIEHKNYLSLYFNDFNAPDDDGHLLQRLGQLRSAYGYVWEKASETIQRKVAKVYYHLVHQGSEEDRMHHENGLLLPGFLALLSEEEKQVVRNGLLHSLQNQCSRQLLECTSKFGSWFEDKSHMLPLFNIFFMACGRYHDLARIWLCNIAGSMTAERWEKFVEGSLKLKKSEEQRGYVNTARQQYYDWLVNARGDIPF